MFSEPVAALIPVDPFDDRFGPGEEAAARAATRSVVEGPTLERFLDEPRGLLRVGVFDREIRDWLGAETQVVYLTDRIMYKQKGQWRPKRRHGSRQYAGHALTVAEYRLLPRLIEQPQLVLRFMPARRITEERLALRLNLLSEVDGRFYNLVVGRFPDDPARVGMISFHEIEDGWARVRSMIEQARTGDDGQWVFRNSLPAR